MGYPMSKFGLTKTTPFLGHWKHPQSQNITPGKQNNKNRVEDMPNGSRWEHNLPHHHQLSVRPGLYNPTRSNKNHGNRGYHMPKIESNVEGPDPPYSRLERYIKDIGWKYRNQ